jgi:hypothetical protein
VISKACQTLKGFVVPVVGERFQVLDEARAKKTAALAGAAAHSILSKIPDQ